MQMSNLGYPVHRVSKFLFLVRLLFQSDLTVPPDKVFYKLSANQDVWIWLTVMPSCKIHTVVSWYRCMGCWEHVGVKCENLLGGHGKACCTVNYVICANDDDVPCCKFAPHVLSGGYLRCIWFPQKWSMCMLFWPQLTELLKAKRLHLLMTVLIETISRSTARILKLLFHKIVSFPTLLLCFQSNCWTHFNNLRLLLV